MTAQAAIKRKSPPINSKLIKKEEHDKEKIIPMISEPLSILRNNPEIINEP